VVDEGSSVVWQGSHPRLALVHPQFKEDHQVLRSSTGDHVQFKASALHAAREVLIWNETSKQNDVFAATDAGDEVAAFLRKTVGARLRLVLLGRAARRREGSNRIHVVSTESFNELAADLPSAAQAPQNLMRFRPNVVVSGWGEPLVPSIEEQFVRLEWTSGNTTAALQVNELCTRCVVPNVDPATAGEDARVFETLSKHSAARYPGKPTYFGLYAISKGACTLNSGTLLHASLAI
jgi:uncharacterized protein YcbX